MNWINVKDELPPPKNRAYWVCYEINGRYKTSYCLWEEKSRKYLGNKWGWRSRDIVRRKNITHWMPFPDPPVKGK